MRAVAPYSPRSLRDLKAVTPYSPGSLQDSRTVALYSLGSIGIESHVLSLLREFAIVESCCPILHLGFYGTWGRQKDFEISFTYFEILLALSSLSIFNSKNLSLHFRKLKITFLFCFSSFDFRMKILAQGQPLFCDVTWHPSNQPGNMEKPTSSMCVASTMLNYLNIQTMLHMTCCHQPKQNIKEHLITAKKQGIRNILALRGGLYNFLHLHCLYNFIVITMTMFTDFAFQNICL